MKALKLSLCFLILLCLSACSDNQLKNLTSFVDSYNKISDNKLTTSDFFFINGSDDTLRAFVDSGENQIILSLKEDNNSKIEGVKLTLPKAEGTLPKNQEAEFFCRVLTCALKAYCSCDEETANEIIDAFGLNSPETYNKLGELTLQRDNYYFVYYSNEVASEVMIFNTYLHTIETTEKPVSRPYYGENLIEKD